METHRSDSRSWTFPFISVLTAGGRVSHREDIVVAELRFILQRRRGRGRPWRTHRRIRAAGTKMTLFHQPLSTTVFTMFGSDNGDNKKLNLWANYPIMVWTFQAKIIYLVQPMCYWQASSQ